MNIFFICWNTFCGRRIVSLPQIISVVILHELLWILVLVHFRYLKKQCLLLMIYFCSKQKILQLVLFIRLFSSLDFFWIRILIRQNSWQRKKSLSSRTHTIWTDKKFVSIFLNHLLSVSLEAVVERCYVNKVFLKISQNLQENIYRYRKTFIDHLWWLLLYLIDVYKKLSGSPGCHLNNLGVHVRLTFWLIFIFLLNSIIFFSENWYFKR